MNKYLIICMTYVLAKGLIHFSIKIIPLKSIIKI